MPYRVFEDSKGAEWQVWDIVPRLVERRTHDTDRRVHVKVIAFADRRGDDRRLASLRRARLRGSYAQGWLAFDNGSEKRRLTPIPADWTSCGLDRLEEYLSAAQVVEGSHTGHGPFLGGDDTLAEAG